MNRTLTILACCSVLAASWPGSAQRDPPAPLVHAHAHNDYEHQRPLLDALDQGFCSLEADVWLVDGKLLVAHDLKDVKPDRTLESLYLAPLAQRVTQNGGRVHRKEPAFSLLVDIKSDAEPTYAALVEALRRYETMITHFHRERTEQRAVTVIVSGNRPKVLMIAEKDRLAGYDGRAADVEGPLNRHFMPWVSESWRSLFRWTGVGAMPGEERSKLREFVKKAHSKGCRVRFWATPELPAFWRELLDAGVDLINTDDLSGLRRFLQSPNITGRQGDLAPGGSAP